MNQKMIVSVFLQMDGPSKFETAKVSYHNEYRMNTPGDVMLAIGAHKGTNDAIQDLPFEMKGAHYGVVPSFVIDN